MSNKDQFDILSTLRYDSNFTGLETLQLSDSKSHIKITSLVEPYLLDKNDEGYTFPEQSSMDESSKTLIDVRTKTTVLPEPSHNIEDVSVNIDPDDVDSWSPEVVDSIYNILGKRFLALSQHYFRLQYEVMYFKIDLHLTIKDLLHLLVDAIICREDESTSLNRQLLHIINSTQCFKMRVLVSPDGGIRVEAHPIETKPYSDTYFNDIILGGFTPNPSNVWDIFLDAKPIETSSFTTFKTTKRIQYNSSRELMLQKVAKYRKPLSNDKTHCEIILYNDETKIMEGSITNIAILKKDESNTAECKYITPFLESGCLCGIMRYYLLKKGLIVEGNVTLDDLNFGDTILIFNGVMGCIKGIFRG